MANKGSYSVVCKTVHTKNVPITDNEVLKNIFLRFSPGDVIFNKIQSSEQLSRYAFEIFNELRMNTFFKSKIAIKIYYIAENNNNITTPSIIEGYGEIKKYHNIFNRYAKYTKTMTLTAVLSLFGFKIKNKYIDINKLDTSKYFIIRVIATSRLRNKKPVTRSYILRT